MGVGPAVISPIMECDLNVTFTGVGPLSFPQNIWRTLLLGEVCKKGEPLLTEPSNATFGK